MSYLGYYLKSYIKDLWNNQPLNDKWVNWYTNLTELRNSRVRFEANNEEEFIEKINQYLPHLNNDDIGLLYNKLKDSEEGVVDAGKSGEYGLHNKLIKKGEDFYFAAPPLLVKHSYHVLCVHHTLEFNFDNHETVGYHENKFDLRYAFPHRYPKSYTDNRRHGECKFEYKLMFEDKAMKYAKKSWGNILQRQPFMEYMNYYFANPRDGHDGNLFGGARTMFTLGIMLVRPHNDIINDHSKPEFIVENENIGLLTHSRILRDEIKGGQGGYYSSQICIYCGGSLGRDSCPTCSIKFDEEKFWIYGGPPISDKMFHYLEDNESSIKNYFKIPKGVPVVPERDLLVKSRENYVNEIFGYPNKTDYKKLWADFSNDIGERDERLVRYEDVEKFSKSKLHKYQDKKVITNTNTGFNKTMKYVNGVVEGIKNWIFGK